MTARGSADAIVVAQKEIEAALTLTAVATGGAADGGDAGVD